MAHVIRHRRLCETDTAERVTSRPSWQRMTLQWEAQWRPNVRMKKILTATILLLGSASAVLAQSRYTTGTAASSAEAGLPTPYGYGRGLYAHAYAPGHFYGRAVVGRPKR
jgi:hypothetical protein